MWRCPAWNHIRLVAEIPNASVINTWLTCTRECGIVLESGTLLQWVDQGPDPEPCFCGNTNLPEAVKEELGEDTTDGEYRVVWTDGASRNNQDCRMRRAGCGVFLGTGNPLNVSCSLPAREQSNQRAELFAVIIALRRFAGK